MIERVRQSDLAGRIVVATTTDDDDDVIQILCKQDGIHCFRGERDDCLDRHYQTALFFNAEAVVKIPSDCPLIDPQIIDKTISCFLETPGEYDFVSNLHPPSYPDGNDVEVMRMDALERAWNEAKRPFEREHTTPYFWENPDKFSIANVSWETGLDYSMTHRWTIDYQDDFDFINTVYEKLYPSNPAFGLQDILDLLEAEPEIADINAKYSGVNWYRHHLDELTTVSDEQTRSPFEDESE